MKTSDVLQVVKGMGSDMARVYLQVCSGTFAIVSAWKSGLTEQENRKRTGDLRRPFASPETQGFLPALGVFRGLPRASLLLPGVTKMQALELSLQFGQNKVIWGDEGNLNFMAVRGGDTRSGPVAKWSEYLGTPIPAPREARVRHSHPAAELWRYAGVEFHPAATRAALGGKVEFTEEPDQDDVIAADKGVPFFYIYDGFLGISLGFSTHSCKSSSTYLEIAKLGPRIWKMPKDWLAAYLPCTREGFPPGPSISRAAATTVGH